MLLRCNLSNIGLKQRLGGVQANPRLDGCNLSNIGLKLNTCILGIGMDKQL